MSVGQDLIRPTTQKLTGQRVIASYFSSNPDKALLAKATQKLMQSVSSGELRSYRAEGGEWIANSTPPPPGDRFDSDRPPADTPSLETGVLELKTQVVMLTAVQEGLIMRLARLEAKLARGSWSSEASRAPARSALHQAGPPSGSAPADDAAPLLRAQEESPQAWNTPEPSGLDPVAEEAATAFNDDQPLVTPKGGEGGAASPDPVVAAPPERQELALPSTSDLAKCIALLIGGDVSAQESPPLGINRTTRDCYAAPILDDRDQTVGLILMDLKATVFLGGTLMMLPRSELEQQLKALSPGEDSIAASAEICNAMSGAINAAQSEHVRVGGLERFEFKSWSWVTEPADRRDLVDSFGGRTVVFSRPLPVQIG